MPHRSKFVKAESKVLDMENGLISAVVSTENVDRDGDIIRQDSWDLRHFKAHPVLLSSHNYRGLTNQIGEWVRMDVDDRRLVGEAKYYVGEGNPEADWGFLLASKSKAAFSVGFVPDMSVARQIGTDGNQAYEFRGQELLEVSQVTVPSNRQSLQAMKGLGLAPEMESLVDEVLEDMSEQDVLAIASGPADGYTLIPMTDLVLLTERVALVEEIVRAVKDELHDVFQELKAQSGQEAPKKNSLDTEEIIKRAIRQSIPMHIPTWRL